MEYKQDLITAGGNTILHEKLVSELSCVNSHEVYVLMGIHYMLVGTDT